MRLPSSSEISAVTTFALGVFSALGVIVPAAFKAYGQIRQQIGELQAAHDANAVRLDNTVNAVEQVKADNLQLARQMAPSLEPEDIPQSIPVDGTPDIGAAVRGKPSMP
jgi:hypothetical protein